MMMYKFKLEQYLALKWSLFVKADRSLWVDSAVYLVSMETLLLLMDDQNIWM